MKLNYKNLKDRQSGFTIVELLIVIVVIGILAGITIVAYSGITARANATKSMSNATSAQSVAESYNADNSKYPGLTTDFAISTGTTHLPAGITIVPNAATNPLIALSTALKLSTVTWEYVGASATTATGGRITWWDFGAATPGVTANPIYVGSATSGSTFVFPAS